MSVSKIAIAGALMTIWHQNTGARGRIARALYGWMTADDLHPGYIAWGMVDDSLKAMGLHWPQTKEREEMMSDNKQPETSQEHLLQVLEQIAASLNRIAHAVYRIRPVYNEYNDEDGWKVWIDREDGKK